jgi:DNA segregation ATPase FtsK/SpoIIIE-like protein
MDVLTILGAGLGLGALSVPVAFKLYDAAFERYTRLLNVRQSYRWREQEMRAESLRVIGDRYAYDPGTKAILDLETGNSYRDLEQRFFNPMLQMMAMIQEQIGGRALPANVQQAVDEAMAPRWPEQVALSKLVSRPTIDNLVIGAYPTERGMQSVSAPLHELMHVLAVGASGWGKSVFLRALLTQLAQARETVEVALIDPYGSEFNVAREWDKLLWPVARDGRSAAQVLAACRAEVGRRRDQYEANAPKATNLIEYNGATGQDVPPWVVVVDEGTAALNDGAIGEPLRDLVQTARQYGVYVVLTGQSVGYRVMPPQVRDQFSTRAALKLPKSSSHVVLGSGDAAEIKAPGRMFVQLVGQEQRELQAPWVGRDEFERILRTGGPINDALPGGDEQDEDEEAAMIRRLDEMGLNRGQIELAVRGYTGGKANERVREVLGPAR